MDRTEASDAFDAGSIPVGCTALGRNRCIQEIYPNGILKRYEEKQKQNERPCGPLGSLTTT